VSEADYLHPSLAVTGRLDTLKADWHASGNLRIEPFLDPDAADGLLSALRTESFEPRIMTSSLPGFRYVYWQHAFVPDVECDHLTCGFGRWLFHEFRDWLIELTGKPLKPPDEPQVISTVYMKGSYLDLHNDYDGEREIAYIIGLTPEPIPANEGGNLQFVEPQPSGDIEVTIERPAGWNTLDVFDVSSPGRSHRVPILRTHRERRAIIGWMLGADNP